jgi:hypothetical protein
MGGRATAHNLKFAVEFGEPLKNGPSRHQFKRAEEFTIPRRCKPDCYIRILGLYR